MELKVEEVSIGDTIEVYDAYFLDGSTIKVGKIVGRVVALMENRAAIKSNNGTMQIYDLDYESYRLLSKLESELT
jgi:hypothetical protein